MEVDSVGKGFEYEPGPDDEPEAKAKKAVDLSETYGRTMSGGLRKTERQPIVLRGLDWPPEAGSLSCLATKVTTRQCHAPGTKTERPE